MHLQMNCTKRLQRNCRIDCIHLQSSNICSNLVGAITWRALAITCGAMATIKERVQRAKQVMDAIVQKYLQNPSAQLLDLKAEGDAELERVGLAQSLQIHPSKTLVHPRNRGTGMLDIPRVPQQVGDISDVAFSWHEVAQACAVRMPPNGSDARRDIEAANANLVIRSGGSFGPSPRR